MLMLCCEHCPLDSMTRTRLKQGHLSTVSSKQLGGVWTFFLSVRTGQIIKLPCFYITEQSQKTNFEICVLKTTFLDPRKSAFLVFEKKKKQKQIFFLFWLIFSFKNNRHTTVLLVGFLKMLLKSYWLSKTPFWPFLAVNNGFCAFLKILTK